VILLGNGREFKRILEANALRYERKKAKLFFLPFVPNSPFGLSYLIGNFVDRLRNKIHYFATIVCDLLNLKRDHKYIATTPIIPGISV
jgi:hypothetical protein